MFAIIFSIHITNLQANAEEGKKNIEDCVFMEMQGELRYSGSGEKVIMLPSQQYTGKEIKPSLTIKDGEYTLKEGIDYTVSRMALADNININTNPWMILSVTGVNETITGIWVTGTGNYSGNVDCTFSILSENQKETDNHFIYSEKDILEGYDGVTIEGYTGTEEIIEIPYFIEGKLVQEINQNAFSYHPTITRVDISNNVFRIMENAFYSCKKLKEVNLSNQLFGIADGAFADCISIKEIYLPETLKVIGDNVFTGCNSMEAIHSLSKTIYDNEGVLYRLSENGHNDLYFYPEAKKEETYSILDGTTWIYTDAFRGAGRLKKIIIPTSVNIIFPGKYGSFYGIKNSVNIVYKHVEPRTLEMSILGPDTFYDLPAGSTITVKNEAMKNAAESAIAEGCRGNVSVILEQNPSTGLTCQETSIQLSKLEKETYQLNWTQSPQDTTEAVSWASSDENIATVGKYTGIVSAQNYGNCTITGTDESGHKVNVKVSVYDTSTKHDFLIGDGLKEDIEHSGCQFGEVINGRKEATLTLTDANWNPESWATAYILVDGYAGDMPIKIENDAKGTINFFRTDSTYDIAVPQGNGEFDSEHYFTEKNKYIYLDIVGLKPGTATITAVFNDNGDELRESITIHVVGKPGNGTTSDDSDGSKEPQDPSDQTVVTPPKLPEPEKPTPPANEKKTQEIKYKKSYQKSYGNKAFKLDIKRTKGNGKISYASSDRKVATVNSSSGKVSIKGTGRCTITVKAAETNSYKGKTIKITLDVIPKKQAVTIKTAKDKKLLLKWKKDTRATGYQLQYSTSQNFKKNTKSILVKKNLTASKIIPKLKKGKTYHVRVRSFKSIKVKGKIKKLYGAWSNTKKSSKIR